MSNDPIVSKLNEYISAQADMHLREMNLTYNTSTSSEGTQRFCSDCKHCRKGGYHQQQHPAYWLCCSPCNGLNLVSGRPNTVYCDENRMSEPTSRHSCGKQGLNFEPKPTFQHSPPTVERY